MDQLEHKIIPALQAGYIVLADRYMYTLIARSIVRGLSRRWSHDLFGFAPKADLVFFIDVKPDELFHRVFQKYGTLDYYESGADIGLSDDIYDSFIEYQLKMAKEFSKMAKQYHMVRIDGNKPISEVNVALQTKIDKVLECGLGDEFLLEEFDPVREKVPDWNQLLSRTSVSLNGLLNHCQIVLAIL